jgi:phosphohistidine phosphatase
MTRRLVVLRHAKAEPYGGEGDRQRSLTGRGRRDAAAVGAWLQARDLVPQAVVCSPAVRTRETLAAVRTASGLEMDAFYDERVYDASVDDLLDVVGGLWQDVETVLLVGHNPGCEELVGALTGQEVTMRTSALVVVTWSGGWSPPPLGGATLEVAATPRS